MSTDRAYALLAELVAAHAARLKKPGEETFQREARAWDAARTFIIDSEAARHA